MTTCGIFGETGTGSEIDKWLERMKEDKEKEDKKTENMIARRSPSLIPAFSAAEPDVTCATYVPASSSLYENNWSSEISVSKLGAFSYGSKSALK